MKLKILLLCGLLSLTPGAFAGSDDEAEDILLIAAMCIRNGNGVIYRGFGTNPLDAVYTFRDGKVYKGDGRFASTLDALYDKGRADFRGQQHLALRRGILHPGQPDIPG